MLPQAAQARGHYDRAVEAQRSGDWAKYGEELRRLGVRTVVNLRAAHGDRDELGGLGLRYAHISAKPWHPEDEDLVAFLQVATDPANQPVFVHCQHGADRTGSAVDVYRMVAEGWSLEDALAEMRSFGFHEVWEPIEDYLEDVDVASLRRQMGERPPPEVETVP